MSWPMKGLALGMLLSAGCVANGSDRQVDNRALTLIYQSNQCQGLGQPLAWVDDRAGLQKIVGESRFAQIYPQIDFAQQRLLVISRGSQPTAGYRLSLQQDQGQLQGGTLQISVNWQTPPAGMLVAQVITHPCLVVAMGKGDYKQVAVLDQNGESLGSLVVE